MTEVKSECAHCWHGTGVVFATLPPIHPEVCCHCGAKRERREALPDMSGHGPHVGTLGGIRARPAVLTFGLAATDPANLNTHYHDGTPKVT